jgi:Tol biopolymer transport system component
MSISVGARLGHYRILAPLGAGGMGEVWLAEDATLKRKVALKVLPAAMADDPDRLARFQREAETVAALSHPNIVTIYSVERDGDVRFLTMELVEGQSLDQLIPPTGMALTEVLDTGVALADALVASHDKGVVHRDVKPANVMLTKDRRVKVLDFGLAKLREQLELGAKTTTAQITGEGRVLGTVAYMSPEQAEAKPVDARSDLFSLGIVLFEMATGERPFQGDSTLSILSAILRDTPKSVTELRADLPPELARIIRQCLKKDPEERYQTAKDVRNQLRALKSDLDSGQIKGGEAITQPAVGPKSRRRWTTVGAGAMAVIALATVLVWRFRPFVFGGPARPFESIRMKRLTDTGKVGRGAISPDGRYAVYSVTEGGQQSLRLQQIATGSDAQIIPPGKRDYSHLKFSPDGNLVYYIVDTGPRTAALYQISTLGGAELPVIDDVSNFSVSPDGARLALQRSNGSGGESGISVTRLDGTGERRLVTPSGPKRFGDFAWSPDGRTIAALVFTTATWNASHIVLIDAETGKERVLGAPGFRINAYDLEWLPGGFLVVGKADSDPNPNSFPVWMVAYPGTEAMPITHDLNMYQRLSATADGRTMVANQNGYRSNIWVMSPDGQGARQITFGRTALDFAGDWAPDGRLL